MINISFNKDLPFSIFSFLHWDQQGRERLSVLVKGTFLPGQNGRLVAARDKPDILFEDQFSGEMNASSLVQESDIAPFKPKTDMSFNAIARSPEAKELANWPVRIDMMGIGGRQRSYSFHVTGPRFFEPQKNGAKGNKYWVVGEMGKASLVPLVYEHSFGGTVNISDEDVKSHPYNPVGTGLVSDYLLEQNARIAIPQIGILAELNEPKPDIEMTVCGLASIVKSWLPRRAFLGSLDENWLTHRHPLMPEDYDFHYWNAAFLPLQVAPYLRGDEVLYLSGLSHDPRSHRLTLPGAGIGARILRHANTAQALPLQLDTFHGDISSENPADYRFTLIWRAVVENPDDIAEIILHPEALSPISTNQGEEQETIVHKAREDKEAQNILQSQKERIEKNAKQAGHHINAVAALASDATPFFSVMLVSGAKADFHIHEQEGRVIITRAGTLEIVHNGSQDFIYAQADVTTNPDTPPHAPQKIDERVTLYVRLMEEEVLVWRPVIAHWHGGTRFYITIQTTPAGEKWEFRPDTRVHAEWRHFNGKDYLVAVALSNYSERT